MRKKKEKEEEEEKKKNKKTKKRRRSIPLFFSLFSSLFLCVSLTALGPVGSPLPMAAAREWQS